jgi:hypothetical protein
LIEAKEILKFQDAELLYTDNKESLNLIYDKNYNSRTKKMVQSI